MKDLTPDQNRRVNAILKKSKALTVAIKDMCPKSSAKDAAILNADYAFGAARTAIMEEKPEEMPRE